MMNKLILSAISLSVCSTLSCSAFAANMNQSAMEKKINKLQRELDQLKASQQQAKQASLKENMKNAGENNYCKKDRNGECLYNPSRISIGPYINKDWAFDGSELVTNTSTVREDARLLQRQYQIDQEAKRLGVPSPIYPRLVFSGDIQGLAQIGSLSGTRETSLDLSTAELDIYAQASSWVYGYMAIDYDDSAARNGSTVFINRGFVTIGNLSKFPIYTTIGQIYTAFGRYSTSMVTSPVTKVLGRTRARAITLGYQGVGKNAAHAEIYGYQGIVNNTSNTRDNNKFGADIGYNFSTSKFSGEVGGGYISDLSNSQGMLDSAFPDSVDGESNQAPAFNVYASFSVNPITWTAELVQATNRYWSSFVAYRNEGAKPAAFHTELNYAFETASKPSSVGIGYGQTWESVNVGLPQNSYSVFYNINIWRNTNLGAEYRHNSYYPESDQTTSSSILNNNSTIADYDENLGKQENLFSVAFDLYF